MSEQESNICAVCGGVKQFWYKVELLTAEQVAAQAQVGATSVLSDPVTMPTSWRLCPGHPEPGQKHDGDLDDYKVKYASEWDIRGVRIQASDPSVVGNDVFLVPHRALSLLAWLTQEKPELERLAKEQGE